MVNKKGFMRIIEATIAIMLVITTLIILSSGNRNTQERDFSETLPPILDEIARNPELRKQILEETIQNETLNNLVKEKINNPALETHTLICNIDSLCSIDTTEQTKGNVFSAERIISASLDSPEFKPKKIKVYIWRKS